LRALEAFDHQKRIWCSKVSSVMPKEGLYMARKDNCAGTTLPSEADMVEEEEAILREGQDKERVTRLEVIFKGRSALRPAYSAWINQKNAISDG
jgi:hypothetical protein